MFWFEKQITRPTEKKPEFHLMTKLQTPPKEATIRFTVDLFRVDASEAVYLGCKNRQEES